FLLGDFLHLLQGVGAALRLGLGLMSPIVINQLVSGDTTQPTSERAAGPVALKVLQPGGDRLEDMLGDVIGIRALHAPAAAPVANERPIEPDQAVPGLLVPVTGSLEQRSRGGSVHCCHSPAQEFLAHRRDWARSPQLYDTAASASVSMTMSGE